MYKETSKDCQVLLGDKEISHMQEDGPCFKKKKKRSEN